MLEPKQLHYDCISLMITNSNNLESGKLVSMTLDRDGGIIGSAEDNHWVIQDLLKHIKPNQFRIEWRDNHFCLLVLNSSILLNNAIFTPKSGFVRLKQNDYITVGDLIIQVHLGDIRHDRSNYLNKNIEDIVSSNNDPFQNLLSEKQNYVHPHLPLPNLENTIMKKFDDPLLALDDTNLSVVKDPNIIDNSNVSTLSSSKIQQENGLFAQNFMELPPIQGKDTENLSSIHVAITPLMRELHTTIPIENSQIANDFLEEIGKTMHATVMGLLALQKEKNNLSDKHLRPIEDNPLRLNLDYNSTVDILFGANKSPVHLSAPAAVTESLHNVLLHNKANTIAITAALTAILDAFSPTILLNRFENYRRSSERQDTTNAWAWEMYKNYYQELTSERQFGFEKLFWEVYSQAYDKALREYNKD